MRKIKFRAWDNKRKQWLSLGNLHMDMNGILFWNFAGYCEFQGNQELSNITLMQFTGLKDKNGKEAYHKDRVEFWTVDAESGHADKWKGTIEWDEEDLCWYVLNDNESWPCVKFRFIDHFEVIGNIYEDK